MQWRAPLYFWLLPAVSAVGVLLLVLLRRRAAALATFAEAPLAARLTPDLDRRRWSWRTMLRLAALLLLVVALAGPKWGFHWQQMKRQGLDIIVAIDTSRSMLATDVKPNRLGRAKLAVLDLVPLLQGDRIGLVPFAGTAFLESPLTMDYAAFERAVRSVEVGIIPRGGTALARAIDTSLEGFDAREGKYEALILITDGEDHEGDVQAAAQRAKDQGVKVFTIGIGTDEGELLPLGAGGFVKDRSGQVVKSRLDEETLKQIALTTGGAYVRGIGPSLGLDQVFREHIAPMERREVASALQRQYEERFQIPLALAVLLLIVETLVPLRRVARAGVRRRRLRRQAGAATVALCLPFLVGFLDPQGDSAAEGNQLYAAGKYDEAASKYGEGLIDAPASPLLQFNLATALYRQGKYDDAIKALEKVEASGEATWVARAAYNAGNAQYQLGAGTESSNPQATIKSWTQALVDYRRAMVADPVDTDAKFNHELVTRKLAELRKKLEDEKKKKEEDDKKKQEQQQNQQQQDQQNQDQQKQDQQQQQDQQQDQQKSEDQQQDQQGQEQQQQQDQQDQQQGQQQQDQEKGQDQQQGQQQQQEPQPGEQQPPQQQQPGAQQEPAQPQVEQGGEQAAAGAAAEAAPQGPEARAAQAVIDTARGEELNPLEIDRPTGIAGSGEPVRDW